jgi:hypothetical protein
VPRQLGEPARVVGTLERIDPVRTA